MKKRIPASEAFAWQFAQACLRHPSIPRQYKNMMMHMEMSSELSRTAQVTMLVSIYKVRNSIELRFRLQRGDGDLPWSSGECTFRLGGQEWKFTGTLVDSQIAVELIEEPVSQTNSL